MVDFHSVSMVVVVEAASGMLLFEVIIYFLGPIWVDGGDEEEDEEEDEEDEEEDNVERNKNLSPNEQTNNHSSSFSTDHDSKCVQLVCSRRRFN